VTDEERQLQRRLTPQDWERLGVPGGPAGIEYATCGELVEWGLPVDEIAAATFEERAEAHRRVCAALETLPYEEQIRIGMLAYDERCAAKRALLATAPKPEVCVMDRSDWSWPKTQHCDDATYGPLDEALTTSFEWDAHFAGYSLPSVPRRLGMNSKREGSGRTIWDVMPTSGIPMVLQIVDVDAKIVGASMTDSWWSEQRMKVERLFEQMPGYCYSTRGGYRLMWWIEAHVIREPIDHARWQALYLARLDWLAKHHEIVGDAACKDFPRLYRLPRVLRGGTERTEDTLREVGSSSAIGSWTVAVRVPDVRPPLVFDANVPEPSWPGGKIDVADVMRRLATYARRQRIAFDERATRRADILERVLAKRALVDAENLGKSGVGRDNTVYEAANLIAWLAPEIGPNCAADLLVFSIAGMDCDSGGGKGRDGYLDKARDVYVEGVKKLHQARAQRDEEHDAIRRRLHERLWGKNT
jgi:hypothetical protein